MKTLTQSPSQPLEFRQTHDTQYVIYLNDENLGAIAFNITAKRWEYTPFGQSVKATGTLEQCRTAALKALQPHPYDYLHATLDNLPPRFHIEHHPAKGYRAYYSPLTPDHTGAIKATHHSEYHPTARKAFVKLIGWYVQDLATYEAFQALLALSRQLDSQVVIDAFELLKKSEPG